MIFNDVIDIFNIITFLVSLGLLYPVIKITNGIRNHDKTWFIFPSTFIYLICITFIQMLRQYSYIDLPPGTMSILYTFFFLGLIWFKFKILKGLQILILK
jgi:hypothetical protein